MLWIGGEQPLQIAIVGFWRVESVECLLLPVMFGERLGELSYRIDPLPMREQRPLLGDFRHQLVDIFKLLERRPSLIARPPVRARPEPHGKRFGEILVRMALGVPEPKMLDKMPAGRIRPVITWIAF